MTKKSVFLIAVVLVLAGTYIFYFTDWFKPKIIHIASINARTNREARGRNATEATTVPVIFKLGRPYKLADIKVVALDEWQTNKDALPFWHLVADTNSIPIARPFTYGQKIRGMKPALAGSRAQPLEAGVKYRLFVTDGFARGQLDFQPLAKAN
jgi:hypothetical protein